MDPVSDILKKIIGIKDRYIPYLFKNYKVSNNTNGVDINLLYTKKKGMGTLIVASHDFIGVDSIIMGAEIIKTNHRCSTIVCAFNNPNKITNSLVIPRDKLKFLFVKKNTTKKIIDLLKRGNNVVIFIGRNHIGDNKSGVYNIAKETKCNVVTAKITSNSNNYDNEKKSDQILSVILFITYVNDFTLEYSMFNIPQENESVKDYNMRLCNKLYD